MSIFTIPKTFGFGDELSPEDLNAIATAVAGSLNVLASENFEDNPGAALTGGQLASAPDGMTTTQFGPGSVTLVNLAVGASVRSLDVQQANQNTPVNSGDSTIDLGVLVDIGGVLVGDRVLSLLSLSGHVEHFTGVPTADLTIDLEMFLGGIAGPKSVFGKNIVSGTVSNPTYVWSAFLIDAFVATQAGDTKIRARMSATSADTQWRVNVLQGGVGIQMALP